MATKTRARSPILEAVHETAKDLERHGFITKREMAKYDLLCLTPVPRYDSKAIRTLRKKLAISQSVLAAILNTSVSTIRQWECGDKHPSGPSLKLLHLIDRKGIEALYIEA
ncbi:MAG: helix-turn-helix domain-containing protein [Burkholderiaceae bacterium]|nr:helix-turn-helix domain-containing protein [Burkholderiaceae bacterium]MCD8564084.1 helix-turn-helix domain-containing protein [Burkholderiaceae bacterium]